MFVLGLSFCPLFAQEAANDNALEPAAAKPAPQEKRVFGVLPNYRTADGSVPFEPITTRQKFRIFVKDSVDHPVFIVSAAFAGLFQLQNQNASFGQGMRGYARRYVTSYADQVIGNSMTEAIVPTLMHDDPRYFVLGQGKTSTRLKYVLTRLFLTRSDAGKWRFNSAEFLGNSIIVAISNAYYPDTRTAKDNVSKLGLILANDTLSNLAKEFWPDIKRKFFSRQATRAAARPADR